MGGMPPSVGRVVHYWKNPDKQGEPKPAIITGVRQERGVDGPVVDLEVFGEITVSIHRNPTGVQQYGKEDRTLGKPCWDWPQVIPSGKAGA